MNSKIFNKYHFLAVLAQNIIYILVQKTSLRDRCINQQKDCYATQFI